MKFDFNDNVCMAISLVLMIVAVAICVTKNNFTTVDSKLLEFNILAMSALIISIQGVILAKIKKLEKTI